MRRNMNRGWGVVRRFPRTAVLLAAVAVFSVANHELQAAVVDNARSVHLPRDGSSPTGFHSTFSSLTTTADGGQYGPPDCSIYVNNPGCPYSTSADVPVGGGVVYHCNGILTGCTWQSEFGDWWAVCQYASTGCTRKN